MKVTRPLFYIMSVKLFFNFDKSKKLEGCLRERTAKSYNSATNIDRWFAFLKQFMLYIQISVELVKYHTITSIMMIIKLDVTKSSRCTSRFSQTFLPSILTNSNSEIFLQSLDMELLAFLQSFTMVCIYKRYVQLEKEIKNTTLIRPHQLLICLTSVETR